ncbi:hypothetical protein H3Z85_07940 [Chryseobacterium indologenes]|uniref:hypothetical protein n=1 Tax=Chryseobacterium indologenes TaxID=253 RepID=UPI0003E05FB5|nr:hypothetical protein [Chryseobacterium indologenes]QPQ53270.1 hypothetical protein H3Z85_07940 [Chryseobacterium indologenes]GAE63564.1 hypothetical protein CIN01S_04_01700 [Chryseobacterium indologenes NBRC 14944]SFJ64721.1 hypothetical protein SAMN05421692_2245 [Chryseobacterium indologenes]SUX52090.1 Uncharacterised protein [Chryseobacterium indologenes]
MFDKIKELLETVEDSSSELIIKDYVPILYFGNIMNSRIATIGLNPSDKEYYDSNGYSYNRFVNKDDLKINSWSEVSHSEILEIQTSFDYYFNRNPYKNWFNRLDVLFSDVEFSYYFPYNNTVHLDIIPVATKDKWGNLSLVERDFLIAEFGNYLKYLITESNIEICILNGQSVVDNFQKVFKQELFKKHISEWDILTKRTTVKGNSYKATLIKGDKKILILGFNHNIQSSFGVSKDIVISIKEWLQKEINNFYEESRDLYRYQN